MPIQIINQDITTIKCDAIVCPSDKYYSGGGGADYDIHTAAGPELDAYCDRLPLLSLGTAAVTPAFKLPCKHIIHTSGPRWRNNRETDGLILRSCYLNTLIAARQHDVKTIAFPLISAGTKGFPKDDVIRIALTAIGDFLDSINTEMTVYLCIYDREAIAVSMEVELREFISEYTAEINKPNIPDITIKPSKSFADTLTDLIDQKGWKDSHCYKKANVSKGTFSKIKNVPGYSPSRETALAFAVALELDIEKTNELLSTLGYTLSNCSEFDNIVRFYIQKGEYDINSINAALYKYNQNKLLGY